MWWRDQDFLSKVEGWWRESDIFRGTPSFEFIKRLKLVKEKIKEWNQTSFKNIFSEKSRVEVELEALNILLISAGMSNQDFKKEKFLKSELSDLLLREEIYWKDKSMEYWINDGDFNTKYFHASVKAKRSMNKINCIKDSQGRWQDKPKEVENLAIMCFKSLLGSSFYS